MLLFKAGRQIPIFLWFYIICLVFDGLQLAGQSVENFIPADLVKKDSLSVVKINKNKSDDLATLKSLKLPSDVTEYITNRYEGRAEYLTSSISEGDFLFGSQEEVYVRKIVNDILKANPSIRQDISVFVSRSRQPNAFNLGDGTIVVNLGLLSHIENEAQLAFILCHEMAHQYKLHVNRNLESKARKYMDKDFQRQLKRTLKQEYQVKKKLEDLLLPGIVNDMRYSREDESEADSIGLIFLSKTGYDVQEALSTMDMLDHVDEEIWKDSLNLLTFFTFPSVPSRSDWFYYQGASSLGKFEYVKDSLEDSLKTHPDCMLRKSSLESQIKRAGYKSGKSYVQAEDAYKLMKMNTEGEIIQSTFNDGNFGRTMYLSLRMLEKYPKNVYPRAMESKCMAIFSDLQKKRKVGIYFSLPSDEHSDNYNRFLSFLMELRIGESAEMSYLMVRPINQELLKYDEYLAALTLSSYVKNEKEEFSNFKAQYLKDFEKGNTKELIETLSIVEPSTKKK